MSTTPRSDLCRTDAAPRSDASRFDARHLFVAERGGMLRLIHRPAGWFLEITHQDGRLASLSVTDDEAARLTTAMVDGGLRV